MSGPDLVNGTLEALGGLFLLNNCRVLYRDKLVSGVSIISTTFFSFWGIWNLYYYPHLDQWLSFSGGLVITAANLMWIVLMVYYSKYPGSTPVACKGEPNV